MQLKFNVGTVYGKRLGDAGEHPLGRALDFMVYKNAREGDALLRYFQDRWADFGVQYVIWEQKYYDSPTSSGESMEDRGSDTANHFDHVHVSFRTKPGTETPTC